MDKIRILLADDHQMMRQGLRSLLAKEPDIEIVGEAADGTQVLSLVAQLAPDIVVMDIAMPGLNGQETTRRIVKDFPAVRVVALSTYGDRRYITQMLEAGACGYVVKATACEELLRALRAISGGQSYLCPEAAGIAAKGATGNLDATGPLATTGSSATTKLSTREREVLQLIAEGLSSRKIAAKLFLSIKTVNTHRRNIKTKLGIHSVAELTKYAVSEGLTAPEL
jgi:two-component system NarL family response regulator